MFSATQTIGYQAKTLLASFVVLCNWLDPTTEGFVTGNNIQLVIKAAGASPDRGPKPPSWGTDTTGIRVVNLKSLNFRLINTAYYVVTGYQCAWQCWTCGNDLRREYLRPWSPYTAMKA